MTVVSVLDAIQQHEAIGVHVEAGLRCPRLVDPRTRTQPRCRRLNQASGVNVLLRDLCEPVPTIDSHLQRLLLTRAILPANRHRKRRDCLLPNLTNLRIAADEPGDLNTETGTHV